MKIITYECRENTKNGWTFPKVDFKKVNLLVGNTSSGKTRFLNTIVNLGTSAVGKNLYKGFFDLIFEENDIKYRWILEIDIDDNNEHFVKSEKLLKIENDSEKLMIVRDTESFVWNDKELEKLARNETSINILREVEAIKPLYEGFKKIMRRQFHDDELKFNSVVQEIDINFMNQIEKNRDMDVLYKSDLNLNSKLFILSKVFPSTYKKISDNFIEVFPFIIKTEIRNRIVSYNRSLPVFCIKERYVNDYITLNDLSSGMKKVLLILTDLFILPKGSIYIIDEYENSLGINAIDFFPPLLFETENKSQFIIATHHPYIINKIPISNWFVFNRTGSNVAIKYGDELTKRYGKSKQQAFIQLMNDPFYREGIEE